MAKFTGGDRVPFVLLFPLGVLLGGVYVAALPLASIGAAAAVGKRLFGDFFARARGAVSFGWRPTEAYLSGREPKRGGTDRTAAETDGLREEADRNDFPGK